MSGENWELRVSRSWPWGGEVGGGGGVRWGEEVERRGRRRRRRRREGGFRLYMLWGQLLGQLGLHPPHVVPLVILTHPGAW